MGKRLVEHDPAGPGPTPPLVGPGMGVVRLVGAIGLLVTGDLPVDGLVGLPDPSRDLLDRLASRQSIGDLDPVILGQVAAADGLVDERHAASVDEPQRPTTGRYANLDRCSLIGPSCADQLEVAAFHRRRRLVPCPVRHLESFRSRFATITGNRQVYAAIFIDAVMVKVRDGQVANRPIYAAIGVTLAGEKDVLGLWAGTGGEGAKFWMSVLTDLRNRGVKDTFFVVCDGLKGLPEVVGNVWPQTIVQTCIIHYADLRIMPMWSLMPLLGWDPMLVRSA